jgi:hypothetical protein
MQQPLTIIDKTEWIFCLSLLYRNRGLETPYYGTVGQILSPGFDDLAVCYYDTQPSGVLISCGAQLIKVKNARTH